MEQVLRAVRALHTDGVLRVKDKDDFAVRRGDDLADARIDEVAVAHHLAREGFVGGFGDGMHRPRDGRAERMPARICRGGGGFFCCGRRALYRRGRGIRFRLDLRGGHQIGLEVRLDDGDLRPVDDLYARALDDDADGARRLEQFFIDE